MIVSLAIGGTVAADPGAGQAPPTRATTADRAASALIGARGPGR